MRITGRGWRGLLLAAVGLTAFGAEPAAPLWKLQFFHDQLDSTLIFEDIDCPTALHCVAVGAISSQGGNKMKPTAVETTDGGEHWSYVELKDTPYSLFFVNDSTGWVTGERKIWRTDDGGLKWTELSKLDNVAQVNFRDASHGWAAAGDGEVYETVNGGKHWTKTTVNGLSWPKEQVAYQALEFTGEKDGVLIGTAFPFGQLQLSRPAWLDPQRARREHEPPAMSFSAVSQDGGQTWKASQPFSNAGTVSSVHEAANGHVLVVMRYADGLEWPSAVLDIDPIKATGTVLFRRKDRVARDALPLPDGGILIATIEPPGTSSSLPIPGKLRMIRQNGDSSEEMRVDYRAVATNAMLTSPDGKHFWVATDTGMILKYDASAGTR